MTKRHDTSSYLGGWPEYFKNVLPSKWEEIEEHQKLMGARIADTTEQFNLRAAMDDYNERLVKSRDYLVYLYLKYFEAKSATAGSDEYRLWNITAAEKELAAAKADHLRIFKEEMSLSFRKVV